MNDVFKNEILIFDYLNLNKKENQLKTKGDKSYNELINANFENTKLKKSIWLFLPIIFHLLLVKYIQLPDISYIDMLFFIGDQSVFMSLKETYLFSILTFGFCLLSFAFPLENSITKMKNDYFFSEFESANLAKYQIGFILLTFFSFMLFIFVCVLNVLSLTVGVSIYLLIMAILFVMPLYFIKNKSNFFSSPKIIEYNASLKVIEKEYLRIRKHKKQLKSLIVEDEGCMKKILDLNKKQSFKENDDYDAYKEIIELFKKQNENLKKHMKEVNELQSIFDKKYSKVENSVEIVNN